MSMTEFYQRKSDEAMQAAQKAINEYLEAQEALVQIKRENGQWTSYVEERGMEFLLAGAALKRFGHAQRYRVVATDDHLIRGVVNRPSLEQ